MLTVRDDEAILETSDRKNQVMYFYLVNDRQTAILMHLLQYSCSKINETMSREREKVILRKVR